MRQPWRGDLAGGTADNRLYGGWNFDTYPQRFRQVVIRRHIDWDSGFSDFQANSFATVNVTQVICSNTSHMAMQRYSNCWWTACPQAQFVRWMAPTAMIVTHPADSSADERISSAQAAPTSGTASLFHRWVRRDDDHATRGKAQHLNATDAAVTRVASTASLTSRKLCGPVGRSRRDGSAC
jgi:hypothetical protein